MYTLFGDVYYYNQKRVNKSMTGRKKAFMKGWVYPGQKGEQNLQTKHEYGMCTYTSRNLSLVSMLWLKESYVIQTTNCGEPFREKHHHCF